ncbi:S66 peptidase family protein [Nocardioides alkalitolerans]|uniref:S66 peptidase family protein n=1 Tax=Nocardioides alkalitolerans TaxID=281714 RepID=UPI0003F8F8DD|nr:LD-carboxypeptidase [Nocardioides alkalitolerans]
MSGPPAVPPAVAPGSRVALVAPAGPPPADLVERAVALLAEWGLEPVVLPSVTAAHGRASYLAGEDAARAHDVQTAWCDPAYAAVLCVRGGYGSARLLDHLDVAAMRTATQEHGPKPLLGSSDVTALHEWLRERLGVATWFAPMVASVAVLDDPVAQDSLRRALAGEPDTALTGTDVVAPGDARGVLVGGNLSLLAMTLSDRTRAGLTAHPAGAIAVLEDVNEATYRLDGYLTSLLRAGWFEHVTGVVCGSWVGCGSEAEVRALVAELLGPLGVPVGWGFDLGHGPGARTVALGVPHRLVADPGATPRLEVAA